LQALVRVAQAAGVWLFSDEAYEHILFDGARHVSPGTFGYRHVLSSYSMSKSYAMSGLRLGYLVCPSKPLAERIGKLLRCTTNGVNSATQWAATEALNGPQDATRTMVAEYQKRRDLLWQGVCRLPWLEAVKPSGAFYLWARVRDPRWPDGWALANHLLDHGIGSAPGEAFGPAGARHIRFAFACATDHIAAAVTKMAGM
jgi:aspartate aminotransferase